MRSVIAGAILLCVFSGCVEEKASLAAPPSPVAKQSLQPVERRATQTENVTFEKSGPLTVGIPGSPCGAGHAYATAKFDWTIAPPKRAPLDADIRKFTFKADHQGTVFVLAQHEWRVFGLDGTILTQWTGTGFGASFGSGHAIKGTWAPGTYGIEVRLCIGTPHTYTFQGTAEFAW